MIGHEIRHHLAVLYGAGIALLIVVLLTPAVGGMARLLGAVDRPGERRRHGRTVPRLGGLALFLGVFVPSLAFLDLNREMRGLLLGAAVATTVGAVDDFRAVGQIIVGALKDDADLNALRSRTEAICTKRPLYPGFRGFTTYVS